MELSEEEFEVLYQIADTVIEVREVDPDDERRLQVFDLAISHRNELLKQFDKRLEQCKNEDDINFVKDVNLNFIVFTLKMMLVRYDCPDENIEFFANHIKEQILQVKRSEWTLNLNQLGT